MNNTGEESPLLPGAPSELITMSCPFPMIQPDCSTPFSELISKTYRTWRIIYLVSGASLAVLTAIQLFRVRNHGSYVQKGVLPFVLIASTVIALRSIDPDGLGGTYGLAMACLTATVQTAALQSVAYAIVIAWSRLLDSKNYWLRWIGIGLIFFTWTFLIAGGMVRLSSAKRENPLLLGVEFSVLIVIELLGIAYLYYVGIRLLRKLQLAGGQVNMTSHRHHEERSVSTARPVASTTAKDDHLVTLNIDMHSRGRKQRSGFIRNARRFFMRQSKLVYIMAALNVLALAACAFQVRSVITGFGGTATTEWFEYNECVSQQMRQSSLGETQAPSEDDPSRNFTECKEMWARRPFDTYFTAQILGIVILLCCLWSIPPKKENADTTSHPYRYASETEFQPPHSATSSTSVSPASTPTYRPPPSTLSLPSGGQPTNNNADEKPIVRVENGVSNAASNGTTAPSSVQRNSRLSNNQNNFKKEPVDQRYSELTDNSWPSSYETTATRVVDRDDGDEEEDDENHWRSSLQVPLSSKRKMKPSLGSRQSLGTMTPPVQAYSSFLSEAIAKKKRRNRYGIEASALASSVATSAHDSSKKTTRVMKM